MEDLRPYEEQIFKEIRALPQEALPITSGERLSSLPAFATGPAMPGPV